MKKNKLPRPITILILTLITAVAWVSLSIYHAVIVKPPSTVPDTISKSLNPSLNTNAINEIESAIYIRDEEIPEISTGDIKNVSNVPATTEPTPTTTPEASGSATPSAEI